MSAEAGITRSWQCGRYTCTLTMQRPKAGAVLHCAMEWAPEQPKRLSAAEIAEYRRGRNAALVDISGELGINAVVVEL